MKWIALPLLSIVPLFFSLLHTQAQQTQTSGSISAMQQQTAVAATRQYALDMALVWPCFIMLAPTRTWDEMYGEFDLNAALSSWTKKGATPQQLVELRNIYNANLKVNWVQDIRELARSCERAEIHDKIFKVY